MPITFIRTHIYNFIIMYKAAPLTHELNSFTTENFKIIIISPTAY